MIQAFEAETLKLSNFYFTGDDYRYRFEPDTRQRFIDLIRERFNAGVAYNGMVQKWDTIIEQKVTELGRVLVSKSPTLDFGEPSPNLEMSDNRELRERIKSLTSDEARRLGVGKSTLHYLRRNARSERRFRVYGKVREKLQPVTM